MFISRLSITSKAAQVYAYKRHNHRNAIGGISTEILQRQCGKERIYVDTRNNINVDNNASRRGGYKRRKDKTVKIVITPVYIGDRPMSDLIGYAVMDNIRHEAENQETSA